MLLINKQGILDQNMDNILSFVSLRYKTRINKKIGEHYRTLKYLSYQFDNSWLLDLGTRAGASAICLASNQSNKVMSVDITDKERKEHNFDFSNFPNIEFVLDGAQGVPSSFYDRFSLILIDLDHNGKTEERILRKIKTSSFTGVLILDDIIKFRALKVEWNNITYPKQILDYAHHTGTGICAINCEVVCS